MKIAILISALYKYYYYYYYNVSIISNEMAVNCKPAIHHYKPESGNEMFKKLHSNLLTLQSFLHPKIKENDPASEADNIFDKRN